MKVQRSEGLGPQVRYRGPTKPEDVKKVLAPNNEKLITLGGYSGLGYQDSAALESLVRAELNKIPVNQRSGYIVNIGGTQDGIGVAYQWAKEMGFKTSGIVSQKGLAYLDLKSTLYCDNLVVVADDTWGGFRAGSATRNAGDLSPTSRAMVEVSDSLSITLEGAKYPRTKYTLRPHKTEQLRLFRGIQSCGCG